MKKIILVMLMLMLPVMVSAKMLVICANPPSGDTVAQTGYANERYSVLERILGYDYDLVNAGAWTLDSGGDTLWAAETKAASGNYTVAVWLNLPEFDAGINTPNNLRNKGCGLLGKYLGRNDTAFPLDMFVMVPTQPYATAGVFADSAYVESIYDPGNSTYDHVPVTISTGDSLFLTCHAGDKPFPAIDTTQTFITPVVWLDNDYVAGVAAPAAGQVSAPCYYYTKTNGKKVWILSYASESWQTPLWTALFSCYEKITPVDVAIVMTDYCSSAGDEDGSSGFVANLAEFTAFAIANNIPVDLFISLDLVNSTSASARASASVITANPNIFRLTHSSYNATDMTGGWFGYSADKSEAQMELDIQEAFDSTNVNAFYGGYIDSTRVFAHGSWWGGKITAAYAIHPDRLIRASLDKGIRTMYCYGNNQMSQASFMHSLQGTYDLYDNVTSSRYRVQAFAWESYITNSTEDSIPESTRGAATAVVLKATMGCRWRENMLVTQAKITTTGLASRRIKNLSMYQPGIYVSFRLLKNRTLDYTRDGFYNCNATWVLSEIKRQVDFFNTIAATYSETGIVPFRLCHLDEVKSGRRTGTTRTDSHVIRN